MCTTIAMNCDSLYFGRNMDLEYHFGERVVIVPRNYPLRKSVGGELRSHHAFIGMAAVAEGYPLLADGMNEHGLCAAALNFPQYAEYPDGGGLSPYELTAAVLAKCSSVAEARELIASTGLNSVPFSQSIPLTTLHWHIADKQGSIVVESTAEGLQIYDNAAGVLTNSPPFPYHLNDLKRCLNLTARFPHDRFSEVLKLAPTGGGFGAIGLAGDHTSESRFVRAAFLLHNSRTDTDEVTQCFHILGGVEMQEGAVLTADGKYQRTQYSCCMDTAGLIYHYTTYTNRTISAVSLAAADMDCSALMELPISDTQHIQRINY